MTDDEFKISEEPPRDEQGHPIHPEREHRICGAVKSERTTPTDHGRERDEYDYCLLAAGWGTDRSIGPCQKHPIHGEQWGESNPNHEHGAYSEFEDYMFSPVPDEHRDALDAVDFEEHGKQYAATMVKILTKDFHDTHDPRKAAEARQWASEFGLIEAAPDKLEVDTDLSLSASEKEQLDELCSDDEE